MSDQQTTDIITRLRAWDGCWPWHGAERAVSDAADEIERLRAALEQLGAMHRRISPDDPEADNPDAHPAWKACMEALRHDR